MTLINDLIRLTPIIKQAFPTDSSIAITDLNQFVAYFPGKYIDLGIKNGQKLNEDEPMYQAIQLNKEISNEIPERIFGFECVGTAIPIKENDQIVGAIGIAIRNQNEKALKMISKQVEESLIEATSSLEETSTHSDDLAKISTELLNQSKLNSEKIADTEKLFKFIEEIANQTKILGINASIIAAQAGGDEGRAFNVVSKEVQKLATNTAESLGNIRDFLKEITDNSIVINNFSEQISKISVDQSRSNQDILSSIEEIDAMVENLKEYADKL